MIKKSSGLLDLIIALDPFLGVDHGRIERTLNLEREPGFLFDKEVLQGYFP
jgi:hypothetical protein